MAIRLGHSESSLPENAEINVTPFIDVILVLLIIFMIAAPLSTVDVPLDLPVSTATPTSPQADPVILSIQRDLNLSIGDTPVPRGQIGAALDAQTHGDKQARVFLRADKKVAYGDLMQIMDSLRDAGYLKVALVELESSN